MPRRCVVIEFFDQMPVLIDRTVCLHPGDLPAGQSLPGIKPFRIAATHRQNRCARGEFSAKSRSEEKGCVWGCRRPFLRPVRLNHVLRAQSALVTAGNPVSFPGQHAKSAVSFYVVNCAVFSEH